MFLLRMSSGGSWSLWDISAPLCPLTCWQKICLGSSPPTCHHSLSSLSSACFPVCLLISLCVQHLSVFALLCLTQEHWFSDSFAFSFPLLPDCLSVHLMPHPWLPLPIPGSPRMARDVIWRAVHDLSLITGYSSLDVIIVYNDASPAHRARVVWHCCPRAPGCSITSIPSLRCIVGGAHATLCRTVLSYVAGPIVFFPQGLLFLFFPMQPAQRSEHCNTTV